MIAFDTATGRNLTVGANSLTYSHTCMGSNLILFVGVTTSTADDIATAPTYAGASMTLVGKIQTPTSRWNYLYYKNGPAMGANNVVINTSDTPDLILSFSASYTGVSQSSTDSSATNSASSTTTITGTTTVIATNCWLMMYGSTDGTPIAAGVGTTLRGSTTTTGQQISDSNGTVGTGGQSLIFNSNPSTSQEWGVIIASFAPPGVAPSAGTQDHILLMGV